MGDMNVTLKLEEHSNGGLSITEDMQDFKDYINLVEVEDIGSSGFFCTWTKSLRNPDNSILNKLDRVMKHGDLTVRAKSLRVKLQEVQAQVEKDPYTKLIKSKAINVLDEYNEAVKDEENTIEIAMSEDLFCNVLNPEEADWMVREVTNNEIKYVMFDIGDNRAPKPDGYTSLFFKRAWKVVGSDVCDAIKEFFCTGQMLGEFNATLISLVLKIDTPNKVSDFRPIACCIVLYKCISKVITNMIKGALNKLVQINQSAFIPERLIQDNIMLSQEILRGYGRKNGAKRCAIKIDLQKAYDTVSWNFLEFILDKLGFHKKMIKSVKDSKSNKLRALQLFPSFPYQQCDFLCYQW
nr:RNA-directed DNA polymerase, eukaryota, reverse transcriptase zinc-binding domain protein [Tanacetum cinerariifolium]